MSKKESKRLTVSRALLDWLADFDGLAVDEDITTDQLEANAAAYGLYKTPQTRVQCYVDGTRDITAYYRFLARQRSQQECTRQASQELLEEFEGWVRSRNISRDLPALGLGRDCQSVSVANTFSMEYMEGNEAVYQLTLAINYFEGVKQA